MRWEVGLPLDGRCGLGPHAAAWDKLNAELCNGHPLLDSRFVDSLLRHFDSGGVRLCIGREDDAIRAMCLLRRQRPGVWASHLPSQCQIGPTLMRGPQGIADLIRALPGYALQIDLLSNDPSFGDLGKRCGQAPHASWHALTISIALKGGFDAYWAARSSRLRSNLRRYEQRAEAQHGTPRLAVWTTAADIEPGVQRYARLEGLGWKGRVGTALAPGSQQLDFYADLLDAYGRRCCAAVYELWFADRLVASRLVVASGGMVVMLKTAYDEQFAACAPGRILLMKVIADAFERYPDHSVEFYTNANADMLAWATAQRVIRHVSFHRSAVVECVVPVAIGMRAALRPGESPFPLVESQVDVLADIEDLPADVEQLFDVAERQNPQCGTDWYRHFSCTALPSDSVPYLHVLRVAGRAVAAMPIRVSRLPGGRSREVGALGNYYTALYAPLLAHELPPSGLQSLVASVLSRHAPVARMHFAPLDPQSRAYTLLRRALLDAGLPCFPFFSFGNWYEAIEGDWAGYLRSRPADVRNTLRRQQKKFDAAGGHMEIVTTADEVERGTQAFERVYAASWKSPEPFPRFMPGLIRLFATRGWLRLGIAWIGGQPIAAQVWIVANGKAYIYKLAYDDRYRRQSPGTLLTAHLLRRVMDEDRVLEIDYMTGDDAYKRSWMSHRRERWGLVAHNPRTLQGALGLARELLGRLLRSVWPMPSAQLAPALDDRSASQRTENTSGTATLKRPRAHSLLAPTEGDVLPLSNR